MRTLPFFTTALLVSGLSLASGRANAQVVTTLAGRGVAGHADGPAEAASFDDPVAVAVDPSGTLYVADSANARIRKISTNGLVSTFADFSSGYPCHPTGVSVDGLGNVWIVDPIGDGFDGGCLGKLAPDGQTLDPHIQWPPGSRSSTVWDDAIGIAADQAGNLYATTYLSGVVRFDANGTGTILTNEITPNAPAIAADGRGNAYVVFRDRIVKVTAEGAVITLAGSGSLGSADGAGTAASFNAPTGIAVDGAGFIYVADTFNNKIRRVTPGGVVETLAGTGARGSADGPAGTTTFYQPSGVALDAAGNLYVADTGNNKIRKISGVAAPCSVGCTNWMVPSVAHVAGADGAFWTSDLVLHNRGSSPAPVTLKFLGNSRDGTSGPERSFTLDPLQTVTYADVLSSVFGVQGDAGALEALTPSDQVTVRSRTFTAAAGGTVGDGIPGVRQGSFFTDQTSPSPVLIGLSENDQFRSNIILVNGTAAPLVVHVAAADASGAPIGSRDYTLPPLGMTQDSRFLARAEFGGGRVTGTTVTLSSTTPGAAFTACAIVIDNASNAPTTVLPQ